MPDKHKSALLIVDVQRDFVPGGALAVEEGDRVVEPIRLLMEREMFGYYVATQDWHPPGHISFASSHEGRQPLETIELYGHEQTLWPDHCVQGTPGAALHPSVPWNKVSAIIRKGEDRRVDSYSGFRNNWNPERLRPATGLAGYLRERGTEELYIVGLARDVCVKWTAEDGVDAGFKVRFIWDLTRSVNPSGDERLRAGLERQGVEIVSLEQLMG